MASPRSHIDTAIAIDLGKTYSRMGIWRGDHDRVDIIANEQGNRTTPSMVAFTNNECYIGQSAKNQAASNPANTVLGAKRLIGRRFSDPSVQADKSLWPFSIVCGPSDKLLIKVMFKGEEKMLTAEEISSMVLLKMKEVAQQYLGYPVNKAVITVPAYFNDSQRRATKDAGRMAGFDVLELLNEPTAAAIAYGLDRKASSSDNGENVLIFDLGREALDVTVLTINKNKIEVKAMGIDTCLGGEDFNTRMVKHFVAKFKWISKVDISSNATALRRLCCACERAKRVLSSTAEAIVEVPCLDKSKDLVSNINRATFEEINIRLFKKCMEIVKKCLKDARLSKTQIDKVVLVGGSTRIPKVQELLQDLFGPGKLHNTINPDEAVVVGAAVHASVLNWSHLTARDVNALSLGVGVKGDIISILIPRNTPFPVRKQRFYTTAYDNWERVAVNLYEGERPDIKYNSFLGGFSLDIPRAPRGAVSVKISMEIDANRMLKVSAEQKTSESMIIANKSGRPSDDDIAKIIAETEKFKNEDERWKEMVELRNALDRYLYSMNKRVNKEKPKLEMERKDVQDMEAGLEETSESQNADKDEPAGIMDNIRNLCVKIEKV